MHLIYMRLLSVQDRRNRGGGKPPPPLPQFEKWHKNLKICIWSGGEGKFPKKNLEGLGNALILPQKISFALYNASLNVLAVWVNRCWSRCARTPSSTIQGLRTQDMSMRRPISVDRLWISQCYHGMVPVVETNLCGTHLDLSSKLLKTQTSTFTVTHLII